MDVLTEIYLSSDVWNEIKQLDKDKNLCVESIYLLSVKLSVTDDGKYILKLIN